MEQQQPRHLKNLTTPFIAIICLVLWWQSGPWWQVGLVLLGMELWDLGWHSGVHHEDLWLAKPIVRIAGFVLAILVALFLF